MRTQSGGGDDLARATAFVVLHEGAHYLVTNWHVVTERYPDNGNPKRKDGLVPAELTVLHHVAGHPGRWDFKPQPLYDSHGEPLWLEHPTHGRHVDVVAVPLAHDAEVALFPYDLSRPDPAIVFGPSNGVSIIGFPFARSGGGGLGVWVQGTIATEPSLDDKDERGIALPRILVDSRTRPGQSGSPVILYRTDGYRTEEGNMINNGVPAERFIGVYSHRINPNSDLGFVYKARALVEILNAQERAKDPKAPAP